jgi:tricorn protease
MHAFDWQALRERYRPLLRHVAHRSDLIDVIAELNVSHAYIAGGDEGLPERPGTGLLGARFAGAGVLPVDASAIRRRGFEAAFGAWMLEALGPDLDAQQLVATSELWQTIPAFLDANLL